MLIRPYLWRALALVLCFFVSEVQRSVHLDPKSLWARSEHGSCT